RGAGKEVSAPAIHNAGARPYERFVVLNCAAVPRTLLMGELLGYEGGQSGRVEGRPGKLELAYGGTMMLDDVEALTVEAQTSLLRVIETQHLIRIGGRRGVAGGARINSGPARHLGAAAREGRLPAPAGYPPAV